MQPGIASAAAGDLAGPPAGASPLVKTAAKPICDEGGGLEAGVGGMMEVLLRQCLPSSA
jgi:hypothetical protein